MDLEKPEWEPDSNATTCHGCGMNFSLFKRKHHCRRCGMVYCDECTKTRVDMPELGYNKPQRICEQCYKIKRRSTSENPTQGTNNNNTNTNELETAAVPDLIAYVREWNINALKTYLSARGPSVQMRPLYWTALTEKLVEKRSDYNAIKKLTSSDLAASIATDTDRTFTERPDWHLNTLVSVRNILSSFHNSMPDVGYQQGMSYIAVILRLHLDEEHAYWLFEHMMQHLGVKTLFVHTHECVELFKKVFKRYLPELDMHFEANNLSAEIFAMAWLRTLFAQQFELNFVVRVWDLFLLDGFNFTMKIVLALFYKHQELLTNLDYAELLKYLQSLPQQTKGDDSTMNELIALTAQFDFDGTRKRQSSLGSTFIHPYNAQFALGSVKWW